MADTILIIVSLFTGAVIGAAFVVPLLIRVADRPKKTDTKNPWA